MRLHVIVHTAVSLDNRTTGFPVDLAAFYSLVPAFNEDATLVGSDTLLSAPDAIPPETDADLEPNPDPDEDDSRPILFVPDSRGRIRTWHYWRKQPYWKRIVVLCAPSTPREYLKHLDARQVEHFVVGKHRVNFVSAFEVMARRYKIKTLRVDSGGTLSSVLFHEGLVSRLSLLMHPVLVGPGRENTFYHPPGTMDTNKSIRLTTREVKKLDNDLVWLDYDVKLVVHPTSLDTQT